MAKLSRIIELGLESRTRELNNQGLSLAKIAEALSDEAQQRVTKDNVYRYINSEDRLKAEAIEKKAELSIALTEAEISTIEDRKKIIKGLINLAERAEDERARAIAYKHATEALDSLDRRIGKLSVNPNIQINNLNAMKNFDIGALTDEQLIEIINSE
jgi:intein-encoded DNA endonuclease-like protein